MIEITPAEESQILAQREAHKIRQSGGYGPAAKLTTQETDLLEQLADLNEARLAMGYSVIGPSPPRSAASDWSAYWGAPAAQTRATEVIGAAESDF